MDRHTIRVVLLASALAALGGCATSGRFLWEEYTAVGISSLGAGEYRRAEQFLNRALLKAEELGPQERGITLNGLGEVYRRQQRYSDAERMFQRALEVKESGLGRDHPDVATTLTNLGLVYLAEGRDEEAAPLLERALSIQETKLSNKNQALGRTMVALATAYRHLGREADAVALEKRAQTVMEGAPPAR